MALKPMSCLDNRLKVQMSIFNTYLIIHPCTAPAGEKIPLAGMCSDAHPRHSLIHKCCASLHVSCLKGKGFLGNVEGHETRATPGCLSGITWLSLSPARSWVTDVELMLTGVSMCSGVS